MLNICLEFFVSFSITALWVGILSQLLDNHNAFQMNKKLISFSAISYRFSMVNFPIYSGFPGTRSLYQHFKTKLKLKFKPCEQKMMCPFNFVLLLPRKWKQEVQPDSEQDMKVRTVIQREQKTVKEPTLQLHTHFISINDKGEFMFICPSWIFIHV